MWFGFILSTIFVPVISGAATAPRWAFAAVALPVSMFSEERPGLRGSGLSGGLHAAPRFTAVHLCGLMFVWYAAISLSWTANFYDGLDAVIKLVIIAEAFVYGSSLVSLRPVIIGFGLGMWVSSLVIIVGWDVPHVTDNAGLFVNSNSMGEIAGLVLVAALFYRTGQASFDREAELGIHHRRVLRNHHPDAGGWFGRPAGMPAALSPSGAGALSLLLIGRLRERMPLWWLIPGILPAFILSQCRGAFVAVAGALTMLMWQRSKSLAIALGGVGIAFIVLSGSTGSVHDRLTLWSDILPHLSIMGHGIGSFYTLYPLYGSIDTLIQRPEHLHNDWLEYGFETGIVGMVACCGFAVAWFRGSTGMGRYVLSCLAIEACFGFPLHMAATAVFGAIVAGHAAVCWAGLRDLLAHRRMAIRGRLFGVAAGTSG